MFDFFGNIFNIIYFIIYIYIPLKAFIPGLPPQVSNLCVVASGRIQQLLVMPAFLP